MQDESVFLERVHRRAAELEQQSRRQRIRLMQGVSAAAGLAAVIVIALITPNALPETAASPVMMQASIFSGNGSLSYIVVGLLAFMLGITVTVLCIKLREHLGKHEKPEAQEEQHDRNR